MVQRSPGIFMKKILLIGKNGQIGWELERALSLHSHVTACSREQINLLEIDSSLSFIRHLKPDIIINAAAYTAVDKAEQETTAAMQINGIAPGILAEEAKRLGALLIHYSTDYVFDGSSQRPYRESDPINPLNVYGKSKASGEKAIEAAGGHYFIFRTSWVYGLRGQNFLLTMLRLAKERDTLKIVNDQIGAPTWSRLIAHATADVIRQCNDLTAVPSGIYHLTCSGTTSWHGFAEAIFKRSALASKPTIIGIPSSEYPTPAKRPAYSVLSNEKIKSAFSIEMPSWEAALDLVVS